MGAEVIEGHMFGLAAMGAKDGAQGVTMTGVSKYGEEFQTKVLTEVLKGERYITEVAEEFELMTSTVRGWLKRHYEANPDDPRRHRIERESERYKRGEQGGEKPEEPEMATAEAIVEPFGRNGSIPHPKRHLVIADLKAGMSAIEAAEKHGVPKGSAYSWKAKFIDGAKGRTPKPQKPEKPQDEREIKAWALFDAGKTQAEARDELKLNGKVAKRFRIGWEEARRAEQRKSQLEAARAARTEKARQRREEGPQQDLPMPRSEPTMHSNPGSYVQLRQPAPATEIVRVPPSTAMADMLRECVDERRTLRGMVDLLQKEQAYDRRKLEAYRALYGEINL